MLSAVGSYLVYDRINRMIKAGGLTRGKTLQRRNNFNLKLNLKN